jgi:hypothetical protein
VPLAGCSSPTPPAREDSGACDGVTQHCPLSCRLVSLTVVSNATQHNVTGARNWAAVKSDTDDVVIEATTEPNTEACWSRINWSGDTGSAVAGRANQRRLARGTSRRYHVQAELGGGSDSLDVWIVWATIEIKMTGQTPQNAVQFPAGMRDESQRLGTVTYESMFGNNYGQAYIRNMGASAKVAPIATLTPSGVHQVITSGWSFRRDLWVHTWVDGAQQSPGNTHGSQWTTARIDDTSPAMWLRLTPDSGDRIYDLDAPDIRHGNRSYESYNNFRQWIEWNGERCSDYAGWYWQVRWQAQRDQRRQIILNEVGSGSMTLPNESYFRR